MRASSSVAPDAVTLSTRPPFANTRPFVDPRAGVKDGDALDFGRGIQAADLAASDVVPGIAARGHDHGHDVLRIPAQVHVAEHARGAAVQQLAEIGHQPGQQRLAFRVAEADVVLQQLRAARRQHQAGVEDAPVGRAFRGHAGDGRPHDLGHGALGQAGVMHGAGA